MLTVRYYDSKADPRFLERTAVVHLGGAFPLQPEIKLVLVAPPIAERCGYQMTRKINRYKLICMDANRSLVCVILNTCLNDTFDEGLSAGSSLMITKYNWFFMDTGSREAPHYGGVFRGILFVSKLTWEEGPSQESSWEDYENPKNHMILTARFLPMDVKTVGHTQIGLFTKEATCSRGTDTGKSMQLPMTEDEVMRGDWIQHASTRCWWTKRCQRLVCKTDQEVAYLMASKQTQDKENEGLSCQCELYGFHQCIVKQQPAYELDAELVFQQAVSRLPDEDREAESFEELSPSKQRWCFYWWYSVNLLHFKTRTPPPECLKTHLREVFKNKPGVPHVGYKETWGKI